MLFDFFRRWKKSFAVPSMNSYFGLNSSIYQQRVLATLLTMQKYEFPELLNGELELNHSSIIFSYFENHLVHIYITRDGYVFLNCSVGDGGANYGKAFECDYIKLKKDLLNLLKAAENLKHTAGVENA